MTPWRISSLFSLFLSQHLLDAPSCEHVASWLQRPPRGTLHIDQVKPEFKAQHAARHHRSQQVPWAAVLPSGVIANQRLTSEGGHFSASRLHRGFCTSLTTYNISNMSTLSLVATPKGPEPVTLLQQERSRSHRQVLFPSKVWAALIHFKHSFSGWLASCTGNILSKSNVLSTKKG